MSYPGFQKYRFGVPGRSAWVMGIQRGLVMQRGVKCRVGWPSPAGVALAGRRQQVSRWLAVAGVSAQGYSAGSRRVTALM